MSRENTSGTGSAGVMLCESQVFGQRCRKTVGRDGRHEDGNDIHVTLWEQEYRWTDSYVRAINSSPEKQTWTERDMADFNGLLSRLTPRIALALMMDVSRGMMTGLWPGEEQDEALKLVDRFALLVAKLGNKPS